MNMTTIKDKLNTKLLELQLSDKELQTIVSRKTTRHLQFNLSLYALIPTIILLTELILTMLYLAKVMRYWEPIVIVLGVLVGFYFFGFVCVILEFYRTVPTIPFKVIVSLKESTIKNFYRAYYETFPENFELNELLVIKKREL